MLHGESVENWSEEPFKMFVMGPWWKPPPMERYEMPGQKERIAKLINLLEKDQKPKPSDDREEKSGKKGPKTAFQVNDYIETPLPARFNDIFKDLSKLTHPDRDQIGNLMLDFLDNADYAKDLSLSLASCFRLANDIDLLQSLALLYLVYELRCS